MKELRLLASAVLICLGYLWSSFTEAAELGAYGQNLRSLGMGGVRVANGEQASVILWNPAGLAFNKGLRVDLFDFGGGTNSYQNFQTLQEMGTIQDLSDLDPLYGKPIWAGLNGYAAVSLANFGFAVFNEGFADIQVNNPIFPEMQVKYFNDYGYAIGGAFETGGLSFGIAGKRISRTGGYQTIGADLLDDLDTSQLISTFTDEGVGYGLDLGLMYKAPTPLNPTLSLAWQNVGQTELQLSRGSVVPDGIRDNLTLGASVSTDLGLAGFAAGAEVRHLTNSKEQLGKKIHLGAELSLLNVDVRAGLYQGYPSYGVGFDLFLFQVDAAMYSVERGAYPGQTPDQRIHVGLSASFGFDPDFNLISIGGKNRRLKQRR